MDYKCKVTVLRREFYQDLADRHLANPQVGPCSKFSDGQEFIIDRKTFLQLPQGFCGEAWDAVSRYISIQISGGVVLPGWTNDPTVMITCCNDGVRPVVFKLERIEE